MFQNDEAAKMVQNCEEMTMKMKIFEKNTK